MLPTPCQATRCSGGHFPMCRSLPGAEAEPLCTPTSFRRLQSAIISPELLSSTLNTPSSPSRCSAAPRSAPLASLAALLRTLGPPRPSCTQSPFLTNTQILSASGSSGAFLKSKKGEIGVGLVFLEGGRSVGWGF